MNIPMIINGERIMVQANPEEPYENLMHANNFMEEDKTQ